MFEILEKWEDNIIFIAGARLCWAVAVCRLVSSVCLMCALSCLWCPWCRDSNQPRLAYELSEAPDKLLARGHIAAWVEKRDLEAWCVVPQPCTNCHTEWIQRQKSIIRSLEFLIPSPDLQGEERLEAESTANRQWFNQSRLCNNNLNKSPKGQSLNPFWAGKLEHFHMPPCPKVHQNRSFSPQDTDLYISSAAASYPLISFIMNQ